MCGICGIYNKMGRKVESQDIEIMKKMMIHRGPDEESSFFSGEVGLGFCRLQIIDLERGSQPMPNEDGSIKVICNGEIYNYQVLREELKKKGHYFRTNSDVEVIAHLYEEEGFDCVKKLRGMFSFVLWDDKKKLLYGARDRFGIKPFYYFDRSEEFIFASEMKGILALSQVDREVDPLSLVHYLTFQYVPEPDTMVKGIKKLPPATYFVLQGNSLRFKKYWEVIFNPQDKPLPYFLEGIQENLREAVQLHTQSDVPWGAFLSGGIDSSLIVALLREMGMVSTFSVGYKEQGYSELEEARATANYLKTNHHEFYISPEEFLKSLPKLVWHFDEPVADPAAISLFFVARMAKEKITVTLSGEGADEVFGGYGIYREPHSLSYFKALPQSLQKGIEYLSRLLPPGTPGKNYVRRARERLEDRYVGNAFIFGDSMKKELLKKQVPMVSYKEVTKRYFQAITQEYDDVTVMQYLDLHTWMPGDILAKADKMTMANSLELRVPYLDHVLFEFAATIPTRYKIKAGTTKYALRQAFKDILPPQVIRRPKRGFPVPTRVWFLKELKEPVHEILKNSFTPQYFDYSYVMKLFEEHLAGRADHSRRLWTIIIFLIWHDIFININKSPILQVGERI